DGVSIIRPSPLDIHQVISPRAVRVLMHHIERELMLVSEGGDVGGQGTPPSRVVARAEGVDAVQQQTASLKKRLRFWSTIRRQRMAAAMCIALSASWSRCGSCSAGRFRSERTTSVPMGCFQM